MAFGSPSLKSKALQWLAQREHSRAELQSKLTRYAADKRRRAATGAADTLGRAAPGKPGDRDFGIQGWASAQGPGAPPDQDPAVQDETLIRQVLDELAAAGFQSDSRTAQSAARTKSPRYGVHRLKQHLRAMGLGPELVASTLDEAQGTELERARELWRRRFGEPTEDRAQLAKQVRFLTARGFDSDIIRRVVRGLPEPD
jgi:regulatory protein